MPGVTCADTPRILIVGDVKRTGQYVRHAFSRSAYRCTTASGPREVRSAVSAERLDAVLLDLAGLDLGDGEQLIGVIRREVGGVPVVVVGAGGSAHLFAARLGAMDVLPASVPVPEIRAAVERAVRLRRRQLDTATGSAAAVEMARRSRALRQACAESQIASPVALERWLMVIYRDQAWMWQHALRVAALSTGVGRALGLGAGAVEQLHRAALLHDVGRAAVPRSLIAKPQPLTEDERALIRTHPDVGRDILRASPYLSPLADIVGSIRERYDGTGYPRGLRGDAIPLAARVIAVAEAFDTLLGRADAPRPSIDRVNAELVRAAGSWFDPAIVQSWLRSVDLGALHARPRTTGDPEWR